MHITETPDTETKTESSETETENRNRIMLRPPTLQTSTEKRLGNVGQGKDLSEQKQKAIMVRAPCRKHSHS